MDDICQQIEQKGHAQIAVVTINSLDGSDIEGYAVDLFKKWGIGSKATDHGVLILLAVLDRKYRIEVGYGLEPILPDGKVGAIGREAVPSKNKANYSGAALLSRRRGSERHRVRCRKHHAHRGAPRNSSAATGAPGRGLSPRMIVLAIIVLLVLFVPSLLRRILSG
jgi:uncharacterized protein